MTPGPTLILQAPGCKRLIKYPTIASGNNFGARFWSDGKREAPMLPEAPLLCKSPSEGVLFWVKDCEVIAEWYCYSSDSDNPEWKALDEVEPPSEEDYLAALDTGLAETLDRMNYIRKSLWRRGNDHIRRGKRETLSKEHMANLTAYEIMLSTDGDNERLLKAEALRELSRFEEALELLNHDFSENYRRAANQIRDLALKLDPKVAEML